MKVFLIVILIAAIIGGFVGGELSDKTFSPTGSVIAGVGLCAVLLLLGAYFHAKEEKRKKDALPPDIRGVFDRMLGRDNSAVPIPPSKPCFMCGGPREAQDGPMCKPCVEFATKNPNHSIHSCGGCGAGFQIGPTVDVIGFTFEGVQRELCACCYEYLKKNSPRGSIPIVSMGREYDAEGQALNVAFPELPLVDKLKRRTNHARIANALASKARRLGISWPSPMLLDEDLCSNPEATSDAIQSASHQAHNKLPKTDRSNDERDSASNEHDKELPKLTADQLRELMATYQEVQKDEGATGQPADYIQGLQYVPPSPDFPGRWPGMPLCGCCSAPFTIDARQDGLWISPGRKDPRPVPICAVCIAYINRQYSKQGGRDRLILPPSYDQVGQQLSSRYPEGTVQRLAIMRIALIRARAAKRPE